MNSVRQARGFTIIEVMMFLGISSLIAVVVIGGTSLAINRQRYQDALHSLQALIQQQYIETAHVVNGRSTSGADTPVSCTIDGVTESDEAAVRPGMSDCLVMGRLLAISKEGDVTTANVLGVKVSSDDDGILTDIEELQKYTYFISPLEQIDTVIAWGGKALFLRDSSLVDESTQHFIILRSPLTGSIRTFSTNKTSIEAEITVDDIKHENMVDTKVCIIDDGIFGLGQQQGVLVQAGAASASGIELVTPSDGCTA